MEVRTSCCSKYVHALEIDDTALLEGSLPPWGYFDTRIDDVIILGVFSNGAAIIKIKCITSRPNAYVYNLVKSYREGESRT